MIIISLFLVVTLAVSMVGLWVEGDRVWRAIALIWLFSLLLQKLTEVYEQLY